MSWNNDKYRHGLAAKGIVTKKLESVHKMINLQWNRLDLYRIRATLKYWVKKGYTLNESYIIKKKNTFPCLQEECYKLYISATNKKGYVENILISYLTYESVAKKFKQEIDEIQLELEHDMEKR